MDASTPKGTSAGARRERLRLKPRMDGRYEIYVNCIHEETGRLSGTTVSPERYLELLEAGRLRNPLYTREQVEEFLSWKNRQAQR